MAKRRNRGAGAAHGPAPGSLADAFGAAETTSAGGLARTVAIGDVAPSPDQPRQRIDAEGLERLADSIRAHGVLQPPLVRERDGGYELIAGERRWRAARRAGLEEIPVFVRPADGAEALELALVENIAREDITPIEEARSLATLIRDLGVTQAELGRRLGMSQSDISHSIRLLDLPDEALALIDAGTLTKNHGKALLAEPEAERRRRLARRAAVERWSVRRLGDEVATARSEPAAPRRGRRPVPAPLRAASRELAARLDGRLPARSVRVTPRGEGLAIQIVTASVDEARTIVERLARAA